MTVKDYFVTLASVRLLVSWEAPGETAMTGAFAWGLLTHRPDWQYLFGGL